MLLDNLSERMRRTIYFARYEASKLGLPGIETEHLLLAVVRQEGEPGGQILRRFGVTSESLRRAIDGARPAGGPIAVALNLPLSDECRRVLELADEEAQRHLQPDPDAAYLLLGILRLETCQAARTLREHGLDLESARREVLSLIARRDEAKPEPTWLSRFGRDLTSIAARTGFDPLIGRDRELLRLAQILSRRTKNNPILVGEAGVGKTALVEGLAQRIVAGRVPPALAGKRILALELSSIVAGTRYRGEFEERLEGVIEELRCDADSIIFIDEIHTLIGTGASEGSLDAANILKPTLSRGEISCIGTTTPREYRLYIEKDRALLRRFQPVDIAPARPEEALAVLEGVKERYEEFHGVRYTPEALRAAVQRSARYITDRHLPDKAIDVLDEAGAWVNLCPGKPRLVTRDDVDEVIAAATGVPVARLKEDESEKLRRMEAILGERVIGQEKALRAISRAIRRSRLGVRNPRRPIGSFLFVGPSGVGKTEVARRLTEFLFDREAALVRFDMSEYMERHAVSKLIGSPPGYVGFEEGGQLSERVRRQPYCLVLFDEIEKAHPDISNLLLQILEDGRLTDSLGNVVDFTNTVVLMTSNVGSRLLVNSARRPGFGSDHSPQGLDPGTEEDIRAELRRAFSPEFLNRLDDIIVFKTLSRIELGSIVELMVHDLNALLAENSLEIALSPEAREWLLDRASVDPSTGARRLRRTLQQWIQDAVSEMLIERQGEAIERIEVGVEAGELSFRTSAGEVVASEDRFSLPI